MSKQTGLGLISQAVKKIRSKEVKISTITFSIVYFLCFLFLALFGPLVLISLLPFTYVGHEFMPQIADFLLGGESLDIGLTQNELSHMFDVRRLILIGGVLLGFSLSFVMSFFDRNLSKLASRVGLVFIGLFLVFFFVDFNTLFGYFHEVFFPMGNWSFPANSLIIQIFPEEFFVFRGFLALISSFIICLLFSYDKSTR